MLADHGAPSMLLDGIDMNTSPVRAIRGDSTVDMSGREATFARCEEVLNSANSIPPRTV